VAVTYSPLVSWRTAPRWVAEVDEGDGVGAGAAAANLLWRRVGSGS
jgi:hypothetical protein